MADNPTEHLFETEGPREVADGVYWLAEFSNVIAFETGAGLVLVDSADAQRAANLAPRLREVTDAPVHTCIYTHGHVDHVHGLGAFLLEDQDEPEVVAHENVPDRFERYARTRGHNEAINARQFGGAVDSGGEQLGGESPFRVPDYPPTRTYRDDLTLEVGELTFELHHGRGETDDHTWLYCPERDVLCTGDFVISASPNPGNPQKVQRYPGDWAAELRRMEAVGAGTLCPGHGDPMVDEPETIRERLRMTEDYLDTIVERTLDALNDGSPPHADIVHEVELPDPDHRWLAEVYDEGEFVVRSVIRYYGGWWTGRPSELKPAPREAVASEIADLCDGPVALAERAEELADAGDLRLACHLADYAVEAAPDDEEVQEAAMAVYDARAESEDSLMATNLYNSAHAYTEQGRPFR
jgi:glyoxylase-like metal-dependent hydrolase (beta-lactamase superfamily II)